MQGQIACKEYAYIFAAYGGYTALLLRDGAVSRFGGFSTPRAALRFVRALRLPRVRSAQAFRDLARLGGYTSRLAVASWGIPQDVLAQAPARIARLNEQAGLSCAGWPSVKRMHLSWFAHWGIPLVEHHDRFSLGPWSAS